MFFRRVPNRMLILGAAVLLLATTAWSASYKVLYSFSGRLDFPNSGLVFDAVGNAYGMSFGGQADLGGIYQLSPATGFSALHDFRGLDGSFPGGKLVVDSSGNLYGTTEFGGATYGQGCDLDGCGEVFSLSPPTHGETWTLTVLYSFLDGDDGSNPTTGVTADAAGNLYGTTTLGGEHNCGVVFELSPGNGQWVENVLYSFWGTNDGCEPWSDVVFDSAGNLYGTAGRGADNQGTVWRLSPSRANWTFTVLHAFQGTDGAEPFAGVVLDSFGNLYGTTLRGGQSDDGTAFELSPGGDGGSWTLTKIHDFLGLAGGDGSGPMADLVLNSKGNVYGTTAAGGAGDCLGQGCGTLFELVPSGNGQWTERRFDLSPRMGTFPDAPLLRRGNQFYGTASESGSGGGGVVFRVTP